MLRPEPREGSTMKKVFAGLLGILIVALIGTRLAIAVDGSGRLSSENPAVLLDAVLVVLILLVAGYFGIQVVIYSPWRAITERVQAATPSATVVSSAIETDSFSFLHSHGFQRHVGPRPFHAAIVLKKNTVAVWRRLGGQDLKVAEINSGELAVAVIHVPSPVGVFPALQVTSAKGHLRLYPMKVSRWKGAKRLSKEELDALVSGLSTT